MTSNYIYNITDDFTNATKVNSNQLQSEINADYNISVNVSYINQVKDTNNVEVFFPTALSPSQKTALDSLVSSYTYTAPVQPSKVVSHQVVVSNDPNNPGDYSSISEAFDAGEESVLVRHGIYYESSDIIIQDAGQLSGEIQGKTIIVFTGPYSIKIDGSGGVKEDIGTISITHNTDIVTGVGTTFTNLSSEQFI